MEGRDGLKVAGASELRRLLKAIQEPNVTNELKDVHYRVAEIVVARARGNAARLGRRNRPTPGRRRRTHRYGGLPAPLVAASTLRATRNQRGAGVILGSTKVPFAIQQEFGTYQDVQRERAGRRGTSQAGQRVSYVGWRQFQPPSKRGYFLYPAISDARDEIANAYLDGIDAIVSKIK